MNRAISVVFPAYNEEDNIEKAVYSARLVLNTLCDNYEIIIVNDGSQDNTGKIIDRLASVDRRIKVIHHQANIGYGGALQSGFINSQKDLVCLIAADSQYNIEELKKLLLLIDEADIVVGYRIARKDPLYRIINAKLYNLLIQTLFRLDLKDINCGFKLFKRKIFDEIQIESKGALIDAEILAKAKKKGYRIKQIGIHHYPRVAGKQTGARLGVIIRMFVELLKLWKKLR